VKIEDIGRKSEIFEELYFLSSKIEAVDVAKIVEYTDPQRKCVFTGARKNLV
jgi:hypothetical protein